MPTLNENILQRAFDGVSWNPEKRAQSVRNEFAAYMEKYRAAVAGLENEAELIDYRMRKAQAAQDKKNGFRWPPKNKAWQAFINYRSESFIKREFLAG